MSLVTGNLDPLLSQLQGTHFKCFLFFQLLSQLPNIIYETVSAKQLLMFFRKKFVLSILDFVLNVVQFLLEFVVVNA